MITPGTEKNIRLSPEHAATAIANHAVKDLIRRTQVRRHSRTKGAAVALGAEPIGDSDQVLTESIGGFR